MGKKKIQKDNLVNYRDSFECLEKGKKRVLDDKTSLQRSRLPISVTDTEVYLGRPDGGLIPQMQNQKKCDYLIYCKNVPQSCFVELKGVNISTKSDYNPYDQIMDTLNYLKKDEELKGLVSANTEKYAFIVSPGRQKIPKGIETKERQLWQCLIQQSSLTSRKISDVVHYVKVTQSERYSNKGGQIICSSASPMEVPFH